MMLFRPFLFFGSCKAWNDSGPKNKTAGLRPRTTPYSFFAPKKSSQKKAPRLLALRVPYATQTFCGREKTRCA